jgi:iron complex outermembrane recepter protein
MGAQCAHHGMPTVKLVQTLPRSHPACVSSAVFDHAILRSHSMRFDRRFTAKLTTTCAAAFSVCGAWAQAQEPAAAPAADQVPQRITITGSNIKRIDQEGVSPLQIISAEEIRRSGQTTITEVLRRIPAAAAGGLTDSSGSNSFSAGASSISLRGLGSQATLVLLNGRRIAPFAPADPNFGQASAVNLDSLPLDVIDRIEVLKDGASAIYGSEAMAGVVNIITKQDFNDGLLDVSASANDRGSYQTKAASLALGIGDLAQDKYNIFATLEYFKRDRTAFRDEQDWLIDKRFTDSPFYRTGAASSSYAGNYYFPFYDPVTLGSAFYAAFLEASPTCPAERIDEGGVCRFDRWPYIDLLGKSDRLNFFTRGTFAITPEITAFAEVGLNSTKTSFGGAPQVYGDFGSWFAAGTGQVVNIPEVLPPDHPNNPFGDYVGYRHRFVEVGPTDAEVKLDAARIVAGLTGTTASWDWEGALSYSQNKSKSTNFNQIRRSTLTDGVLNGTYNFLDPSAGALSPDDLRINTTDNAKSSFVMLDLKGSRELTQLPGGPLSLAAGMEVRHEERSTTPDEAKLIGEVVGFGAAASEGKRNVYTAFGELNIPIVKSLEAQLAARFDRYSDYGTSTNPKVGLLWTASPALKVRASYQTGFRAPSLTEIADSDVSAFTTIFDAKRCVIGDEIDCGGTGIGLLIASNPTLRPEKSKGFNFGVVFEPIKDVSASIDYFHIARRNEVDTLDIDEIIRNEDSTDPKYAGRVTRGPADPNDPLGRPGPIQTVTTGYFNLGETKVAGIDLDVRAVQRLAEYGKINLLAQYTHYTKWKGSSAPDQPLLSYLGYYGQPRTRGRLGAIWEYADFTVGAAYNYVSKFKTYNPIEVDPEQCDGPFLVGICTVGAWESYDLSLGYEGFKDVELALTVQNVANKRPPVDPNSYSVPAYNADFHSPYGRYYTLSLRYQFY